MENQGNSNLKNLQNELTLGKELAKQLQIHHTNPSSSNETRELLINKILNSYDRALHMLHAGETFLQPHVTGGGMTMMMMSESPRSLSISPRSEDSDHHRDFNTHHKNKSKETPKKSRKNMPRWTKHVRVSPWNGLEGPFDDEYTWRKYGQKDILGAKYPRSYYRCTLRHVYGCMATKQVQRTDDDQTIFEITYRGTHTCNQNPDFKPPPPPPSSAVNQDPATSSGMTGNHHKKPINSPPQPNPQEESQSLLVFPTGLKVRTENLEEDVEFHDQDQVFDSVNFCTATSASGDFGSFPIFGGSSSMVMENDFGGNPCPSLMSPATSGSNYFGARIIGNNHNSHASESGDQIITGMASAATSSTTNSPRIIGVNFPVDQPEFAPDFTFDNLESFS